MEIIELPWFPFFWWIFSVSIKPVVHWAYATTAVWPNSGSPVIVLISQLHWSAGSPPCWVQDQGRLAGIFVLGVFTSTPVILLSWWRATPWWCRCSLSAALTLHGSLGWKDTCGSRTTPGWHHCSAPTTHQKEEIWNLKIGHCVYLFLNCLPCCCCCLFVFPRIMIIKQSYSLGLVAVNIIFQNNGQECPL